MLCTTTEWAFSNFGLVQSKLRNQFGSEEAAKLDMLHTAAWKCWTGLKYEMNMDQDRLRNVWTLVLNLEFHVSSVYKINLNITYIVLNED